jgi:hypothetical protein
MISKTATDGCKMSNKPWLHARVKLGKIALAQGLNKKNHYRGHPRIEGIVACPYPVEEIVTVLWDGRKTSEHWHISLLDRIG